MQRFTPIIYRGFGGLNEDENPAALAENELRISTNVALLGGLLGTRPGIEQEATGEDYEADVTPSQTGDASALMLFDFRQGTDFKGTRTTDSALVLVCQGKTNPNSLELWMDDSTANTALLGTATMTGNNQNNVWVAATHQDAMFLAGGDDDDTFCYYEFETARPPVNTVTAIDIPNIAGNQNSGRGNFVTTKWGYVFVCGFRPSSNIDNSYNPMIVRYNTIGTDPKAAASWPSGNSIGAGAQVGDLGGLATYGDEFTTGLGHYRDQEGDWLIVCTNKKLASITRHPVTGDFVHDDDIANGCVHQRAYVELGIDAGDAIYMSNRGIHSLRQSQRYGEREDSFLSWKIRRTFADLNPARLQYACGAYDDVEGWVLFAVTTSGQSSHDLVLCLDVKDTRELNSENAIWSLWRLPEAVRINCMTEALDAQGKRRIYVGTVDDSGSCKVGRFTRDIYTDFTLGYSIQWATKYSDMGSPSTEKQLGDMYTDVGPPGNYSAAVRPSYDFGGRAGRSSTVRLPDGSGALWGAGNWNAFDWAGLNEIVRQSKIYLAGRFFNVSFVFSHGGDDEPVFWSGFTVEVAPVGRSRAA